MEAYNRVAEYLVAAGLTTGAAARLARGADVSLTTEDALKQEANRIASDLAGPDDFGTDAGVTPLYLRALRRRVQEEQQAKQKGPVDLNERLRQANPLSERLGRYR